MIQHRAQKEDHNHDEVPHSKYQAQTNLNHTNSKQDLFGYSKLEFGAYLGFGICGLEF